MELIGVDTGHINGDCTVVVKAHDNGQHVVVDEVQSFKCGTCFDTGEVAEMIHDCGDDLPGGGIFTQSGRTMPCPDCQ
jgi:predicted aconitase with swiveling domain